MANSPTGALLQFINRMIGMRAGEQGSDAHLLEQFITFRSEAAFEVLLKRHGPLVLGVCRRVLGHEQDADDVFQATFLVLARQAGSIRKRQAVGSWLYGVAYRPAMRAKAEAARRRKLERQAGTMPRAEPSTEPFWKELTPVLDEELHRLPEKYRAPLILCHLQGKTHEQAAHERAGRPVPSPGIWRGDRSYCANGWPAAA